MNSRSSTRSLRLASAALTRLSSATPTTRVLLSSPVVTTWRNSSVRRAVAMASLTTASRAASLSGSPIMGSAGSSPSSSASSHSAHRASTAAAGDAPSNTPAKGKASSKFSGKSTPSHDTAGDWVLPHPLWHGEYIDNVKITHIVPPTTVDALAYYTIKLIRFNFDWMSGYTFGEKTERKWLTRVIFLETIAAVPGSIAATLRHLRSLRQMRRDHGWIHTLLEEAENERMHLMTFLKLRQPGIFMRLMVLLSQGLFFNFYWVAYLVSPRFCHRLVGYLEEEAVITYTRMLKQIDDGDLWKGTPAPAVAKKYWKLADNATMREVIAVIRADEAHHRDVNHVLAEKEPDQDNPFLPGH